LKRASIQPAVPAEAKTFLQLPVVASFTLKVNAPATGCESAEITRHVAVYVPRGSVPPMGTDTDRLLGRVILPESTRLPAQS